MKRKVAAEMQGIFVEYVQPDWAKVHKHQAMRTGEDPPSLGDLCPPFPWDLKETHGAVYKSFPLDNAIKEANTMAANEKIRVRLKSYDHTLIDAAAAKIVEVAQRNGSAVSGPIPLPTEREIVTILRAVHKYKDSREQFEMRTHKRLIDILNPQAKTIEALMNIELPAGVEIEIVKA